MRNWCDAVWSKQVYQALSPAHGGRADVGVAGVVARMARAKVGKSYGSAREALLLSANFVAAQLQAVGDAAAPFISSLMAEVPCELAYLASDPRSDGSMHPDSPGICTAKQAGLYSVQLLEYEVYTVQALVTCHATLYTQAEAFAQQPAHGAMTIREPGAAGSAAAGPGGAEPVDADEEFARQLQAKMDAADARKCAACGRRLQPASTVHS